MNAHRHAHAVPQPDAGSDTDVTQSGRETVEVTYYPVLKNRSLGRRMTRTFAARRGENPFKAAERELARRYKVRDYLIFDAHLAQIGFLDRTEF
ncbi:MAG: hypothetical protein COW30_01640 [Rhodospirillales bacterium CG15_BIG_FIL_POST_REV_8_21_14_020_66_15]|nr:MAG: hypothetical protein COW30_01640 [Rhodospirillales bacterium CG15_BIG_FIL_POST_REV_8_21_14_020_66_15]